MKFFKFFAIVFSSFVFMNMSAQTQLDGTWVNQVDGMKMIFRTGELESTYKFEFADGGTHTGSYWTMGTTINFNGYYDGGLNESFDILRLDENYLVLKQQFNADGQPITFTRDGSVAETILDTRPEVSPYDLDDNQILFSHNGIPYTQGHFNQGRWFGEFLLGRKLSPTELAKAKQEASASFKAAPQATLNGLAQVRNLMQQIFNSNDILQIGIARNMILAEALVVSKKENSLLNRLLESEIGVLDYDQENKMVLTEQDIQTIIDFGIFTSKLQGADSPTPDRPSVIKETRSEFRKASADERKSICLIATYAKMIMVNYESMDTEQKQSFTKLLSAKTAESTPNNTGNQISPDTYTLMNNISLSNHAMMMNSIEAMGGGNTYWYVK